MPQIVVDGIPALGDSTVSLRVRGLSAFVRSPHFIARFSLESGQIKWLAERPAVLRWTEAACKLPRRILASAVSGSVFWCGEEDDCVAELLPTEDGALLVAARSGDTGRELWEHFIPIPEAADWAEASPAWPGAQTEKIDAFIAHDARRLVVALSRETRRERMFSPQLRVETLPPYACQTDATRLDPGTGTPIWQTSIRDVGIGIRERQAFTGIWTTGQRVGLLALETGTNRVLHEYPHSLGWPVRDGSTIAVPWHSKREVGIAWLDERGSEVRRGTWPERVKATNFDNPCALMNYLHATEAGLALQVNDQTLWWLGKEDSPRWKIRAKPYIYNVHSSGASDVFVGTDGRGGRFLAFDPASGHETLNLKPAVGGAGTLVKVPGHPVLVATFLASRNYTRVPAKLLVLNMTDRTHRFEGECGPLLGTWTHGAVCAPGRNGERLAIVDIR